MPIVFQDSVFVQVPARTLASSQLPSSGPVLPSGSVALAGPNPAPKPDQPLSWALAMLVTRPKPKRLPEALK